MMRVGLFKPVHVKTLVAQEQQMPLTSRKLLQRKQPDVESDCAGRCAISVRKWASMSSASKPLSNNRCEARRRTQTGAARRRCAPTRACGHGKPLTIQAAARNRKE